MVTDIWHRRIYNSLIMAALIIALLAKTMQSGVVHGFISWAAGAGIGFLLFIPGYVFKKMGAGDVKLATALAAFFSASQSLQFGLLAYIAGGIIAATYLLNEKMPWFQVFFAKPIAYCSHFATEVLLLPPINQQNIRPRSFPFAVALAAATGCMIFLPT